jgi:uncharacterized membrane protein
LKGSTLLWLLIGGVALYYVVGYIKFSQTGLFGPEGLQLGTQPVGTVPY